MESWTIGRCGVMPTCAPNRTGHEDRHQDRAIDSLIYYTLLGRCQHTGKCEAISFRTIGRCGVMPTCAPKPTVSDNNNDDRLRVGRLTTRAEDAQGTNTQSHIKPSILIYEDNNNCTHQNTPYHGHGNTKWRRFKGYRGTSLIRNSQPPRTTVGL